MGLVQDKLFCAAPWNHFFVQQDGDVRVCCMVGGQGEVLGNINEQSWEDIWYGEKYQNLRKKFLERDPETLKYCKHCLDYDKFGEGSCRHQFNGFVKESERSIDFLIENPRVVSLDLRTSRTCGLACLICGPWNSSRWEKELNFKNRCYVTEEGYRNVEQLIEDLKRRIVHVNIVGGEPFMMKEAMYLLQEVQPYKKRIKILINTNCQTLSYRGQEVLPLLEGFDWVQIDASIDAVGKAAEYQRYGAKWEVIKSNFEKLLDTPYKIWVHPTVSIFNILRLVELLQYLDTLDSSKFELCGGNMLFDPEEYSIVNIPVKFKDRIRDILEESKRDVSAKYRPFIQKWVDFMYSQEPKVPWEQIKQKIESNDQRRGNRFLDINPEFEDIW